MTSFPAGADEDIDETVKPADLPTEDSIPMDSIWHRNQMNLFHDCLETRWAGRKDFFSGGNLFLHFSVRRHRNREYLGPDFFVVLDTDHDRERRYWATWDENGRFPNFIAEFLSPTTAANDRGRKKDLYEQTFRTPEYFLFDEFRQELEGYRLTEGVY